MNNTCYGVDFSGAGVDSKVQKNIAIASAKLDDGIWHVDVKSGFSRDELLEKINASAASLWALDFPFSLPKRLAEIWFAEVRHAHDVWAAMSSVPQSFVRLMAAAWKTVDFDSPFAPDTALDLVQATKPFRRPPGDKDEPKRMTDRDHGGQSCIHSTQPDMIPMVHKGIRLLHQLKDLAQVMPWSSIEVIDKPVLVETYPSAVRGLLGLKGDRVCDASSVRNAVSKALDLRIEITGYTRTQSGDNSADSRDAIFACLTAIWLSSDDNLQTHTRLVKIRYVDCWSIEGAIYVPLVTTSNDERERVPSDEWRVVPGQTARSRDTEIEGDTNIDQMLPSLEDIRRELPGITKLKRPEEWDPIPDDGITYRRCRLCGELLIRGLGIDGHISGTRNGHAYSYGAYKEWCKRHGGYLTLPIPPRPRDL